MLEYLTLVLDLTTKLTERNYDIEPILLAIKESAPYSPEEKTINDLFEQHYLELIAQNDLTNFSLFVQTLQWIDVACLLPIIHLTPIHLAEDNDVKKIFIQQAIDEPISFLREIDQFNYYHRLAELSIAILDAECVRLAVDKINEVNKNGMY
jgi:hypothetical protein